MGNSRDRFIWRAATAYAVVGTLWILFSDRMLSIVEDPATLFLLNSLKGLAYVAVTTALLVWVLRQSRETETARLPGAETPSWPLWIILAFLALVICVIGALAFRAGSRGLEQRGMERLQAIASLKAAGITDWLRERERNAEALNKNPMTRDALARWLSSGNDSRREQAEAAIESLRARYGFTAIELRDRDNHTLITLGRPALDRVAGGHIVEQVFATGEIRLIDMQAIGGGALRLGFAMPLTAREGGAILAVAVFEMDAADYLLPYLDRWPLPTMSGQTVLVRRDGDKVVYLNAPEHGRIPPLSLRRPLSDPDLPSARYLRGEKGPLRGADYRGVPVLTAAAAVPGTPWLLLAKEDTGEAFADISRLGWISAALILLALAVAAFFVALLWQRQRLRSVIDDMEQKQALAAADVRFRATFEQVAVGMAHLSREGRWIWVNSRYCEIMGVEREQMLSHSVKVLTSERTAAAYQAAFDDLLAGRTAVFQDENVWQRPDGRKVDYHLTVSTVRDAAGLVQYLIVALEDTTHRKAIEAQLRQSQKMEAIGNLTGGLAHDFNNLLGVIIGNLDLLEGHRRDDEELDELCEAALGAALRGAELTRRLLAFARRQPLQPQQIDINRLITGLMQMLSRILGEDIEVTLELGPDTGPVMADPAQLEASLTNLAANARDAMPHGGRLVIASGCTDIDENYVSEHPDVKVGKYSWIRVTDSGVGIAPDVIQHIFDPFFTTKPRDRGTGLGLSMVFGFMKQSGGHINVYSEPGVGTSFTLYLPCLDQPGDIAAAPAAGDEHPTGRGETILVAEDSSAFRKVVARQLTSLGYTVLEAGNGLEALAVLETQPVDLLLTDIIMPGGMNGMDLAKAAALRWPDLKIILTSGFPETSLSEEISPGAFRLLVKPYRQSDLARMLREVLPTPAL